MSELAFISPGAAPLVSPLARTLAGAAGIGDLSLLGKLEVRNADPGVLPDGASLIRSRRSACSSSAPRVSTRR